MAKFTRGGGEANALAYKKSRAILVKKMLHFVAITVGTIGIYQQTSIQKT